MYNNNQFIKFCKPFSEFCEFVPNQCCFYYKTSNPKRCGQENECLYWTEDYMSWEKPGLLRFFFFMMIQFVIMFVTVLISESGYFRKIKYQLKSATKIKIEQLTMEKEYGDINKDDDVIQEEKRIAKNKINPKEEIFVVNGITKYFDDFMAVKGISFTLKPSECFGLLGVNGAGKSTSFKMLTGDEFITKGDATISGISIKNDIKNYQKKLGYCPQFDPLIDQMTVIETMKMYALLRGIKPQLVKKTCLSLINLLDLDDHIYKMCYTLSGGNKRKLSVAIALIGSPVIVLLDEPTSGMDPITRRILWNSLIKIKSKGKSLILTTHSMDETEVLCSNIGIMVNGELKCMGSLQHLNSKYGEGYNLLVKINLKIDENKQKINDFIDFIQQQIKKSEVKENRDGFINIHLTDNSTSFLSHIFEIVEKVKLTYSIEYYSITRTNLEQIFINFASRQIDPESRIIKKSFF